jgi:hypothetical protein
MYDIFYYHFHPREGDSFAGIYIKNTSLDKNLEPPSSQRGKERTPRQTQDKKP